MADLDFPTLIKNARQFDQDLDYARKKLLDASKLGMGKNAFSVMSGIKNELEHLLRSIGALYESREEENQRHSAETSDIFEFIETASKELDYLENLAAEEENYKPFQKRSSLDGHNMVSPVVSNEHGMNMPPRRLLNFDQLNIE